MKGCRVLTQEEIQSILNASPMKYRTLFQVQAFQCGGRVSEVLELTFGDFAGERLYLKSKKHSENQSFPIRDDIRASVNALRSEYEAQGRKVDDSTPVFLSSRKSVNRAMTRQSVDKMLRSLCEKLGIDGKVNSHSFRKQFVTGIYEKSGKDIVLTQQYSRHKNLANLQYYIDTTNNTDLVMNL